MIVHFNKMMKNKNPLNVMAAFCSCLVLTACTLKQEFHANLSLNNAEYLPEADVNVQIPSLSSCTNEQNPNLQLNTQQPVTLIVHGCFPSAGQFRSLADVFAFHRQQTVCFNYDDRDSLEVSSAQLITAVEVLSDVLQQPTINVIGHSQGGLVARRAFTQERKDRLTADSVDISLTTISAPFGGIEAASHCGSKALAWLSLGLVKPLCQLITGSKYREIPPNSRFIRNPGRLLPVVGRHLKIATDEVGSCRRYNHLDVCVEDDYVFSLTEQTQTAIEEDAGLSSIIVKSGHVEIVGDVNATPTKLIGVLQQEGILNPTPAELSDELAQLLARLYLSASTFKKIAIRQGLD